MNGKTKELVKWLAILAVVAAFIRVFPDLRRYAKIEMM